MSRTLGEMGCLEPYIHGKKDLTNKTKVVRHCFPANIAAHSVAIITSHLTFM